MHAPAPAGTDAASSRNVGSLPLFLVALDEGPDVVVDRAMMVVGRHPQCDVRLDSIRISRHHCCMTPDRGDLVVRDLGSTNGIRINGQRVEMGRVRPGDELSIAHIRFRLAASTMEDGTVLGSPSDVDDTPRPFGPSTPVPATQPSSLPGSLPSPALPPSAGALPPTTRDENPLAAAVRGLLPSSLADRCKIEVIVHMDPESDVLPTDPDDPETAQASSTS
jgi:hypothetical protein